MRGYGFDNIRTSVWRVLMEHMLYEYGKRADGTILEYDGHGHYVKEDISFACVNQVIKKDSFCYALDCSLNEWELLVEAFENKHSVQNIEDGETAKEDAGSQTVIYYLINLDSSIPEQEARLNEISEKIKQLGDEYTERIFWDISIIGDILKSVPQVVRQYVSYIEDREAREDFLSAEQKRCLRVIGRYLEKGFMEEQFSKMEQAGSVTDEKVALQNVFVDLEAALQRGNQKAAFGMFVHEMIQQGNHVNRFQKGFLKEEQPGKRDYLLLGTAGQGKSTVCQYLIQIYRAAWLTQSSQYGSRKEINRFWTEYVKNESVKIKCRRIPIHITVKEYAAWLQKQVEQQEAYDVLLYIKEQIRRKTSEEVFLDSLRELFAELSWIFVFDGLDEVPSSSNRERLIGGITDFLYGELRRVGCDHMIICTSRPQGNLEGLRDGDFRRLRLEELSKERCLVYLERLMGQMSRSEEEKERFMKVLRESAEDEVVSHLMKSPLQATIVAILVKTGGKPPRDRYNLFDTYYQTIKNREKQKETLEALHDTFDWMDDIHYCLALRLQKESESDHNPSAAITKEPLLQLIQDYLREKGDEAEAGRLSQVFFDILTKRLSFITDVNTEGEYMFSIRSMQEFLAANEIVRRRDEALLKNLEQIAPGAYWRNVFLFTLGYINKNKAYLKADIWQLCERLNGMDCAPTEYSLEKISHAGSWLALDILIEGIYKGDVKTEKSYYNLFFQVREQVVMEQMREYGRLPKDKKEFMRDAFILPQLQSEKENLTLWYLLCLSDKLERVLEHLGSMSLSLEKQREIFAFLNREFPFWEEELAEKTANYLAGILELSDKGIELSYEEACQVLVCAKPQEGTKALRAVCRALLFDNMESVVDDDSYGSALKALPGFWNNFQNILQQLNSTSHTLKLADVLTFRMKNDKLESEECAVLQEAEEWFSRNEMQVEAAFLRMLLQQDKEHAREYIRVLWQENEEERADWLTLHAQQCVILSVISRRCPIRVLSQMPLDEVQQLLCFDCAQKMERLEAAYEKGDWDEFWKCTDALGANGASKKEGIRRYLTEQGRKADQISDMNDEELAHFLFVAAIHERDQSLEDDEKEAVTAAYEEYGKREWNICWVNIWARKIALNMLNEKSGEELLNQSEHYQAFLQTEESLYLYQTKEKKVKSVPNLWKKLLWLLQEMEEEHPVLRVIPSVLLLTPKSEESIPTGKYRQLLDIHCKDDLSELGRLLFLMRVPDWDKEETETLGKQVVNYLEKEGTQASVLFLKLGETYDVKRSPEDAVYLKIYEYLMREGAQGKEPERKYLQRLCELAYQKIQAE